MVHNSKVRAAGSHIKEQIQRFGRLFFFTFAAQIAPVGFAHLDRTVLISAAVGALEVIIRQFAQTVPTGDVAVPVNPASKTVPAAVVYGDAAP